MRNICCPGGYCKQDVWRCIFSEVFVVVEMGTVTVEH